jgi:hypothetical protein
MDMDKLKLNSSMSRSSQQVLEVLLFILIFSKWIIVYNTY